MQNNLFLFHGENQEALKKEALRWKKSFLEKNPDSPNLTELDGKYKLEKIVTEAKTVPFLGDKRLIIVKNLYSEFKGTPEYDKFATELENLPETTILLVTESETIPKNAKVLKDFKKYGTVREFLKSKQELKNEFKKIAKKAGKDINENLLNDLIEKLNQDPYKIKNEAQKLSLYCQSEEITQKDIDEIVRFDTNISVFQLMDDLTQKQTKKCIKTLHQLNENQEDLVKLFYLFARQIRILLSVKYLESLGLSNNEVAKASGLQPFVINKTIYQVKHFEFTQLQNLLEKLLELDIKIKSGEIKYSKSNRNGLLFELEQFLIDASK